MPTEQFDCTVYCGPQMDGRFCCECKQRDRLPKLSHERLMELKRQCEWWTGTYHDSECLVPVYRQTQT